MDCPQNIQFSTPDVYVKEEVPKKINRHRVVDALGVQEGLERVESLQIVAPAEGGEGQASPEQNYEDDGFENEEVPWPSLPSDRPLKNSAEEIPQ